MSEKLVRGLLNIRKLGSKSCKCQKMGFEGLGISASGPRRFGNVRKWGSGVWICQKIGFECLEMSESRVRGLVNVSK